jgi:hypothetical protein
MNKHNKSLGNRSTNTLSLSNKISTIKESINPRITVVTVRSHPKPTRQGKEVWTRRMVRCHLSGAANAPVTLTYGKIFADAGITASAVDCRLRVLGVKVWNYTNQGNTSNFIRITSNASVLESGAITVAEDVGCSSSLPGVGLKFPETHTDDKLVLGTTTTGVIDILGTVSSLATVQTYLADVLLEYKFSSAE